jgi:uncharacterized membrane protein
MPLAFSSILSIPSIPSIKDFFQTYFVNSIVLSQGYNPINTVVYATILVVAVYFIYRALGKLRVKVDKRFGIAIAPFIVFGSMLRVTVDAGIFFTFLFTSPLIYFFVFAITFTTLVASLFLENMSKKSKSKKSKLPLLPYYKTMFAVGFVLVLIPIAILATSKNINFNTNALLTVLGFYLPWPLLLYFIKWKNSNKTVLSVQMFDATNTFVSLNFFGYSEQHVVPNIFINLFGPSSFIVVKAVVIVAALILIDKYSDDKQFNNYLKLVIGILGGATSVRDFMRLLLGV